MVESQRSKNYLLSGVMYGIVASALYIGGTGVLGYSLEKRTLHEARQQSLEAVCQRADDNRFKTRVAIKWLAGYYIGVNRAASEYFKNHCSH